MIKLSVCILQVCAIISIFYSQIFAEAKASVTFVYMAEAEPHCFEKNGSAEGIEPEIVDYLCNQLGIQAIHKFYPWKRAQEFVKTGEADAMMTTPTPARFKYAIFGKENSLPAYWNIFSKKNNDKLNSIIPNLKRIHDLKPFVLIDFIGNGWTKAFMKEEEGYKIFFVAKMEQIPLMLSNGRGDLVINSATMINYWAKKLNISDKIIMHEINWPWTRFHYVFMVSRKSPWVDKGLIRALDDELKKMKARGAWKEILKKYHNPYGYGKPFRSMLDAEYLNKNGFYIDYENYPVFEKKMP